MEIRLSFIGFNAACARVVRGLASIPEASVVGILAHDVPQEWPLFLDPPPLFSNRKEMFRAGKPNLLLVADDIEELKGVPSKCQVIEVQSGAPAAGLLEALPIISSLDILPEEEMEKIASLCAGVNVVEAYSNPLPKLAQLLDRAMALSGAELGMVLLPGEVLDELKVVLARGDEAQHIVGRGISVTKSLCGRAFDAGETVQGDLGRSIEENRCLEGTEVGKLLAIPLRAEGRVIGVFALGRKEAEFDALKLSLLTLIGDQASLAMQISRLYSELETNVVMDSASGLYNQNFFNQRVNEEVSRAHRYSLNVCLVVAEIDDFEDYLKRNGRFMSDFIISDVGNIIKRNTRDVDTAARYGDKMFAILLPETRRLGAMRFAERIRKVMEDYPFPSRERKEVERLTICAGIASFPASAENEQELLDNALTALAAAKASGPSNIRLFSPTLVEESNA
jgi:diguanylate cyclase (GGDEF)-like protein